MLAAIFTICSTVAVVTACKEANPQSDNPVTSVQ